jgi:hypothetical protein
MKNKTGKQKKENKNKTRFWCCMILFCLQYNIYMQNLLSGVSAFF